ncbi:MAG: hypothetical protein AAF799_13370 [Myxococcota bacterium]
MLLRSLCVVAMTLALASGCPRRTSQQPTPTKNTQTQPTPTTPTESPTATPAEPEPAEEPAAGGTCGEGGQPWDGKAQGCSYEHDGCCYASAGAACAAAGCGEGKCIVLESYPAQIACRN